MIPFINSKLPTLYLSNKVFALKILLINALFLGSVFFVPICRCRSRIPLVRPDSLSIGSSSETDDISSSSGVSTSMHPPMVTQRQQSDADSSTSSDNDTNKWHPLPKEAWKLASEVKHYY